MSRMKNKGSKQNEKIEKLSGRNFCVGAKSGQRSILLEEDKKKRVRSRIKREAFIQLKKKEGEKKKRRQKKKQGGIGDKAAMWGSLAADELEGGQELKETVQVYEQIYDVTSEAARAAGRNLKKYAAKRKRQHRLRKGRKEENQRKDREKTEEVRKGRGGEKRQRSGRTRDRPEPKSEERKMPDEKQTESREDSKYTGDSDRSTGRKLRGGDRKRRSEHVSGRKMQPDGCRERTADRRGRDGYRKRGAVSNKKMDAGRRPERKRESREYKEYKEGWKTAWNEQMEPDAFVLPEDADKNFPNKNSANKNDSRRKRWRRQAAKRQEGKNPERQKHRKQEKRRAEQEGKSSRNRNGNEEGRKKRDKSRKEDRRQNRLEERQKRTLVKKRMIKHFILMLQNDNKESMSAAVKDIVVAKISLAAMNVMKAVVMFLIGKVILILIISLPFFFLYQLLLASPFAVFFPIGENLKAGQVTAREVILEMQREFQTALKEAEQESSVDGVPVTSVTLQYANLEADGIPDTYYDILTVYAVKYNMGDFVLILEKEDTGKLREVFDRMCFYTVDDSESSYEDELGETYYEISRTITVNLLSYTDLINEGYFNKEEKEILNELMKPENLKLMQEASGDRKGSSLTESEKIEINKNLVPGEKGSEAVRVAMTKVGAIYSQARRYEEGYYDCSSLTYRVYLEVGVDLSYQGTNVASYQARKMVAEGRAVAYEDLAPGDLIFWANEPCDSYLSITHVGLYAGNGKTIEASYSKGQVVYRNIWGVDEIVLCARPYDGKEEE